MGQCYIGSLDQKLILDHMHKIFHHLGMSHAPLLGQWIPSHRMTCIRLDQVRSSLDMLDDILQSKPNSRLLNGSLVDTHIHQIRYGMRFRYM